MPAAGYEAGGGEVGDDAGHRRRLHPLVRREFTQGRRAVAFECGEHGDLGGGERAGPLLTQSSGKARYG
jgi:hypothetical protein